MRVQCTICPRRCVTLPGIYPPLALMCVVLEVIRVEHRPCIITDIALNRLQKTNSQRVHLVSRYPENVRDVFLFIFQKQPKTINLRYSKSAFLSGKFRINQNLIKLKIFLSLATWEQGRDEQRLYLYLRHILYFYIFDNIFYFAMTNDHLTA